MNKMTWLKWGDLMENFIGSNCYFATTFSNRIMNFFISYGSEGVNSFQSLEVRFLLSYIRFSLPMECHLAVQNRFNCWTVHHA